MHGVLREGTPADVRNVVRLHANCSSASIKDRYLAPMPTLEAGLASRLLDPAGGFSLVAQRPEELVGIITVTPLSTDESEAGSAPFLPAADVGLLVADSWHRQGIGTRLLLGAVRQSGRTGIAALEFTCRPGNTAVLRLVTHAGLRARVSMRDGLSHIKIPLTARPARGVAGEGRRSLSPESPSG